MRLNHADEIFRQARNQAPEKRKAFLEQACAGDVSLRLEVERLLSGNGKAEQVSEAPAADSKGTPVGSLVGRSLSHYQLLEKIGEGGMGVVYRARDEHLQRDVAVKVLPRGTLDDSTARKRFRTEALALSRLNHPNIATVYDFDTQDDIDFLVMEYLRGMRLNDLLASGPLAGEEVTRLGEQLAEGLEAAHAQGVVHCDLKPGNLIIVAGGRLKILDFGLARLLRTTGDKPLMQSSTVTQSVGGTVPYMSPEQLRGETIDARSDLFSCGAVLYEMATGRRAFEGKTPAMVSDAILRRAPTPPARLNPEVPAELERIILKALEKRARKRYQSAKELLAALRGYRPFPTPLGAGEGRGKRSQIPNVLAWAALIAAALLAFTWFWMGWRRYPLPEPRPAQITRIPGWAGEPEVSPDGNQILYSSNASGNRDIWLTDLRENWAKQLTNDPADDSSPNWFPDGKAVAFVKELGGVSAVWTMNLADGQARQIIPNARDPAVSPGGKLIAFARASSSGYLRIGVTSIGNPGGDVKLLTDDKDGLWDHSNPTWSPDGAEICYSTRHGLWIVPVSGEAAHSLTSDYELDFEPAWSHKTPYIYFSSYRGGTLAIWRVLSRGGKPERVTMGTGPESHPSLPWDGRHLVYTNGTQSQECVLLDRTSGKTSVFAAAESDYIASIEGDGARIAYASRQGGTGSMNLWIQEIVRGKASGPPRQLTRFADRATFPAFSPDGRWIAFYRIIREERDIWTVSDSGREPSQFTTNPAADMYPAWSPDGSMLAFSSERAGGCDIWVAGVKDGKRIGPERQLTIGPVKALMPAWSWDGTSIAFTGELGGRYEVYVVPFQGGSQPVRLTDGADVRRVRWDPLSGDILASATSGGDRISLWRISPRDGSRRPFTPEVEFGEKNASWGVFDVSRDGQFLSFARGGNSRSQIWTLEARKGVF